MFNHLRFAKGVVIFALSKSIYNHPTSKKGHFTMSEKNINPAHVRSAVKPIVNVRIAPEEMDIIRKAAKTQALSYSAFIRHAAVSLARQINNNPVDTPAS